MSQEDFDRTDSELEPAAGSIEGNEENAIEVTRRELDELLPAYGIGATDPEETEFVQAELVAYPEGAAELAEYAALSRALLHSAGERAPSAQLAGRLRAAIREETAPAVQTHSPTWWERLLGRGDVSPWPRLAVSAVIVLLLVLNVAAVLRIRSLQEENRFLAAQLSNQRDALALMTAGGVQIATLPAAAEGGSAQATVRWTPEGTVAVVNAEGFPALEPDMAYQLWLIRDGQRTSGGLFTVDSAGTGTLIVRAPDPVGSFDAMGITPEPATGSPGPTAPPVVVGTL